MKILCVTILLQIFVVSCFGQDIIRTVKAGDINAKVLEINETSIKYKKYDYLDGPTFTLQKSEIISIQYQYGTSDVFSAAPANNQNEVPAPAGTIRIYQSNPSPDEEIAKNKTRKYPDMKRVFINVGASFPLGRCAQMQDNSFITPFWEDVDNYGGAQTGFSLGVEGRIPVSKHFGITIRGNFLFNGIKEPAFREEEDYITVLSDWMNEACGVYAYDYRLDTRSKYLNVPILVGVNYTHLFGKGLGLSVGASVGLNIGFITPTVFKNNFAGTLTGVEYDAYTYTQINYYSAEKLKYVFTPTVHFAYSVGGAFIFAKRWSLGVEYYGTTKSNIKFSMKETSRKYKGDGDELRYYCGKLGFNMLMVKIGVGF